MKLDVSVSGNFSFRGGLWFFLALVVVLIAILALNGVDASPLINVAVKVLART